MVDRTQRVSGSVYDIGPKAQPGGASYNAALAAALSLASIDAKIAGIDTNNMRMAADATVRIGNDERCPVPVRGVVAIDPTQPPLALPLNASQEAGGNLAAIAARTPALGPGAAAASSPVVLALDQPALPLSLNAATEDGHLRAIRDVETARLRIEMADFVQRAAMCGAFIPCPEV